MKKKINKNNYLLFGHHHHHHHLLLHERNGMMNLDHIVLKESMI